MPTLLGLSGYETSNKTSCTTVGDETSNKSCIFPFIAYGITFNSCTLSWSEDNVKAWCATEVDGSDELIPGKWEYCEPACQPTKLLKDTNDEPKHNSK